MSMQSKSKKRKHLTADPNAHIPIRPANSKQVYHTVTSASSSSTQVRTLARVPVRPPVDEAPPLPDEEGEVHEEKAILKKPRTQSGQLLDDFEDHFLELGWLLLEREADCLTNTVCVCGSGLKRTTKCYDCLGYAPACRDCFVHAHIHNPTHWAEVWDEEAGFFIRHDISTLDHTIQLGHGGGKCPTPTPPRSFTIVDINGVHTTRVAFCSCREQPPNKIRQLMRAGMFPATAKDPHTAFTIQMLKDFQLHNFESKKAAYDHLGAIRRLTDNSFTADVPNPYAAFLCVVRVFNYLTLVKRSGQLHEIDTILSHRPSNLLVWCPACPEPGFNSDRNCPKTPSHLRHLNQSQRTLDGNHQCNQYSKNNDPDDVSLCNGKGYFPLDSEYQEYLKKVPATAEKSTCNYLKVVNKQDKKKFKNMAITGTVNCQCSHVFILSSVDLPHAERFANADYAFAMALRNRRPKDDFEFKLQIEVNDVDEAATYDIACEYIINLPSRFEQQFPDLADTVKKIRWGVPALHVQGHQDSCTYLFGTAFMECVAHFHGETAEHYWPESNQLGPHTRQMNLGHRQDTLIAHHGDWNHKKTSKIAFDLAEDIQDAKKKYSEKRNHFIALSISYSENVPQWQGLSRSPSKVGKEAVSVYKHDTTKVPSQKAIYEKMLNDQENFKSSMVPKSKIARFLDSAIKIQENQRKLANLIKDTAEHELQSRKTEVEKLTAKLRTQIVEFRKVQIQLMPKVGDRVAAQASKPPALELECLYIPSDFDAAARKKLGLDELAAEEAIWREGQLYDILRALQNIVKAVSALRGRKKKNDRQQKQNTRTGEYISDTLKKQGHHIQFYAVVRQKIVMLNGSCSLPILTEQDLFMKSVQQKKHVGDSKRTDGLLFRAAALSAVGSYDVDGDATMTDTHSGEEGKGPGETVPTIVGTQMNNRRKPQRKLKAKTSEDETKKKGPEAADGWIWNLGKYTRMTDEEMDAWASEGDRVQWFRAEADMQRWQEQIEQKLAELLRTRRSFLKMESVWLELAPLQPLDRPGAAAYARQKAAMYRRRASEAYTMLKELGYETLVHQDANLLEFVEQERKKQADFIRSSIAAPE
ncbi:CxC2 domain-containing protein [Favolaschia claudopus]|uniref:CxC2 domain-containing protein n=1 Tax=Favolaschia claudopus TaxID=2862362 RepID=A0AAW0D2U6_9AGAR